MSDRKWPHSSMVWVPLLFGLWFLSDVLLRPRVALYRTVDIIQIVASSATFGIALGMAIVVRTRRRTAERVVDIQQTLDGILAETTPASTEASGALSTSAVTVDRARLLQLRERLEALLAALNRR